ncbi:MAG: heme-copper oxidase subunit III [SAR202 cluster bacterium]|jgi:cytochrome c oxidase subunit 3|nr:cytochrome oxidase subunit III [Chloroflexota bacterium]MDP6421398.1 cytochrome c oxidase subunit 3 [SAR202 cluster bacterium]HAL48741.1 heme-copper oxidase subunit III [Dehalococcoidia bacterium]MDP6664851.1 cytochrome c oxidase subunit 3 [SAR202 cluster bacterium]MQG56772.1 heme-copper oxidase subunit III [SAR202 cluster bacterium]|tara:strand:- start:49 stop:624 length:576 start_codon:yes stop_codon:yes gene_type:complete
MATSTQVHASQGNFNRASIHQIGIWLFFTSELFLFGALVSTRYYLRGFETPEHVDQLLGLAITAILLLSSLSAYRAETAISHGQHRQFVRNLSLTILFGVLFMVGVGIEWYEAFQHFPPSTGYGTVFFTTTGIHAVHVFSGIVMLVLVLVMGRKAGRFGPDRYWGVEGVVKYWHFVDVAWVFIYPTLYLVG